MTDPVLVNDIALVMLGCGVGIAIGGAMTRWLHRAELANNKTARRNLASASFAVAIALIIALEAWVTFG